MTAVKKSQTIKSGKENGMDRYKFISAIATVTRLMGVISLKINWKTKKDTHFIQWFMLDAEEHGIYDYVSMETFHLKETERYTRQFMGSLGGITVMLTKEEAAFLVKEYAEKNNIYHKPLPQPFSEYEFLIMHPISFNSYRKENLLKKICENVDSPVQVVNYFIMRASAKDFEGMKYLLTDDQFHLVGSYKISPYVSTLLKNEVHIVENKGTSALYLTYSTIDAYRCYLRMMSQIGVTQLGSEYKVVSAQIINKTTITPEEAALEIQKPEYIQVYKILGDKNVIAQEILERHPEVLKYQFQHGTMFVQFRKNNDHVKETVYHIGRDMEAIYFINDFNELIICYYDEKDSKSVFRKENLIFVTDMKIQGSVIYQYAESIAMPFIEYISNFFS